MGRMHIKQDERNKNEREGGCAQVEGRLKREEANERHRPGDRGGPANIKRRREQRGVTHGEHLRVCDLHLRHWASRASKWEEQSRPQQACQPLMFSHRSTGYPMQLWCTLLRVTKSKDLSFPACTANTCDLTSSLTSNSYADDDGQNMARTQESVWERLKQENLLIISM